MPVECESETAILREVQDARGSPMSEDPTARPKRRWRFIIAAALLIVMVAVSARLYSYLRTPERRANGLLAQVRGEPPSPLQRFLRALGVTGSRPPEDTAKELAALGPPVVPLLCDAMREDNSAVREVAARALGELGDRTAVPVLLAVIDIAPTGLRGGAARYEALMALGRIGDPRAIDPLLWHSVEHAAELPLPPDAPSSLVQTARVSGTSLRLVGSGHVATEALVTIGAPAIGPLSSVLREPVDRGYLTRHFFALGVLCSMAEAGVDAEAAAPLLDLLQDKDELVRTFAAIALAHWGYPQARPVLVRVAAESKSPLLRKEAEETLKRLSDARTIDTPSPTAAGLLPDG